MSYICGYIDVLTLIMADGRKIPKEIHWDNGKVFKIDDYIECGIVLSFSGKPGILYKIKIKDKERRLYYDKDTNRWFIDLKTNI